MRKLKYLVITSLLLFMSCKEKEEKLSLAENSEVSVEAKSVTESVIEE